MLTIAEVVAMIGEDQASGRGPGRRVVEHRGGGIHAQGEV